MSPLSIEIWNPGKEDWQEVIRVKPGERPGSFSNIMPDGTSNLLVFECAQDDSKSSLYLIEESLGIEIGDIRAILSHRPDWKLVKTLEAGGEVYETMIKTRVSPEPRLIRFIHKKD